MAKQNFECPIETPAKIAGDSLGDLINRYFHVVTAEALGGGIFKAGLALSLLLAIFRFGLGDRAGVKEFGKYIAVALLLIMPLPTKSLMILCADIGDHMFQRIVQGIGGLDPGLAGGGVGAVSAFEESLGQATSAEKNDLKNFLTQCYYPASGKYSEDNNSPLTPGPADSKLTPYYDWLVVEVTSAHNIEGTQTCSDFKNKITANLNQDYNDTYTKYATILKAQARLSDSANKLLTQYGNIPDDQLLANATAQVMASSNSAKDEGAFNNFLENFTQRGEAPGQFGRSVATSYFRVMLVFIGEFFVLIFDYYIYNVVAVIKIFAAMSMALGILYYMFLKRLELPLAGLGVWMSANGLYVVAAIAMNVFYKRASYDLGTGAATLMGLKNSLSDALFSVAVIGIMSTSLAALLSWKGISLAIHTIGGAAPRIPRLPGPGAGKR